MGGKPKSKTTTTQKVEPWEPQQEYLLQGFGGAQDIYQQNINRGVGHEAARKMYQLAQGGAPGTEAATDLMQQTISGDYLQGNPYVNQAIERAMRPTVEGFRSSVMPGLQAGYAQAGRYGSPGMQRAMGNAYNALGRSLGDVASTMMYRNYADERSRQMQAAGMVPGLEDALYRPFERMLQSEDARYDNIRNYMGLISGSAGRSASGTATEPNQGGSPLAGALGGAQLMAGLGAGFGGPAAGSALAGAGALGGPWGLALGAGLGALGGLF